MNLLRRATLAAAVAAAALAVTAAPARAVFSTDLFGELTGELVERRDNDFAAPLTRPEKKQLAAVTKSLTRFDRPADDLGDDAASLGFAVRLLQRAFPDEFGPEDSAKSLRLGDVVATTLATLRSGIGADLTALEARVAPLLGRAGRAARSTAARARKAFDAEAGLDPYRLTARAARLTAAVRTIQRATKLADRAVPGTAGSVTASVDGVAFASLSVTVTVYQGDDTLQIDASRDAAGGGVETIRLTARGVTGPGDYALASPHRLGYYGVQTAPFEFVDWQLLDDSGTLHLTTFDVDGQHVAGTFSFDGFVPGGETPTQIREGAFDLQGAFTVFAVDGFVEKR